MSRPAYLAANETFYADFWTTTDLYTSRFPNAEEAGRAAVILRHLSEAAERRRWDLVPPRLLDAGCGRGWLTNLLSLYGAAEGCEPSAGAVAVARTLFPHLPFHALTPGELRATPGFTPFQVVVSSEVIEHIPPDLQLEFLRDLHACVDADGLLVLTTPRGELWDTHGDSSNQLLEHWLTEAALERLLRDADFVPRQLSRAVPVGGTLFHRVKRRLQRERPGGLRRPSIADAALDARHALYQIWLAERRR